MPAATSTAPRCWPTAACTARSDPRPARSGRPSGVAPAGFGRRTTSAVVPGPIQVVAGTIDVEAGDRARFLAQRVEQVRATRLERGCLDYVFSADPDDDGRVR